MPKSKRRSRKLDQPTAPRAAPQTATVVLAEIPNPPDEVKNGDAITLTSPAVAEPVTIPAAAPVPIPSTHATLTPRALGNAITVQVAFYALVFFAALLTRFIELGARPLAEHEAASALFAWQFLQGTANGTSGSPALLSANLLIFLLAGATDTAARFPAALIGSTVVLLPVLARREIGRAGACIASLILLFSTSLVFFARDLNGVETSAVAGTAAGIWFWRYAQESRPRDLYLGAVAAALALTASAAGFTTLCAGVILALVSRRLLLPSPSMNLAYSDGNGNVETVASEPNANQRGVWRNAFLLFAVFYVSLATAFLMNRGGLGAAFGLLGEWLSMFRQFGPLTTPLNLLLLYEPLVLVFGFAGLLLVPSLGREALRTRGSLVFFVTLAVFSLAIYSLVGVKSAANMVVLVIPLAMLAGWFIGNLIERALEELDREGGMRTIVWGELPIFVMALVVTVLVFMQLTSFLQRNTFSPGVESFRLLIVASSSTAFEPAVLLLGLITLVILIFLALLSVGTIGASRTANLAALTVAFLLALSGVRALWLANFSGSDTVTELLAGEQTSLQARDLVRDLQWESQWRAGDGHVIGIRADESLGPVVQWYLRAFPNIQWVTQAQISAQATGQPEADSHVQALVMRADAPAPTGNWISQRYNLLMNWELADVTRVQLFKWLIYRDGGVSTWQAVKLWVPQPQ